MEKLKDAYKYVTFIPTGEEFCLMGSIDGTYIFTTDINYIQHGFNIVFDPYELKEYYKFFIDTEEKLKLFTNAHRLYYVANYKGQQFAAGVSKVPMVTLFSNTANKPNIAGFVGFTKGQWIKEVDISEVEIIPIIEPIDLSKHLRKK